MTARVLAIIALVVVGGLQAADLRGEVKPAAHERTSVAVDVLVLGPDSQPVGDLTQADFQVFVDNAPVPIADFARSKSALSVVMLVDGTASQPLKRYEITTGVTTGFVPSLQPGDRARMAWLGTTPTLSAWLSAERTAAIAQVRPVLDRLPIESSPIWDAIDMSVQALADAPEPRVILLMTDGRATGNRIGLDDAERKALEKHVSISAVSEGGEWLIPQFGGSTDRARSDASLKRLSDETGGMYLPDGTARRTLRAQMNAFAYVKEIVNTPSQPAPLITQIMASLRTRYRIGFSATADGQPHSLDVRVKRSQVEVRAPKLFVN
jgi:hypothetical protein